MSINSISFANFSDKELNNLQQSIITELLRREEERQVRRIKWIEKQYFAYLQHPNSHAIMTDKRTTVVSLYSRRDGLRMAYSRPCKGDVYDYLTGIAVAFAKANGEEVPSYI